MLPFLPDPGPVSPRDAGLLFLLTVAVFTDLRSQKIYNALTFPMTALGVLTAPLLAAHPWDGLAGAATGLLLTLPVEAIRAVRMGDVKLLMAAGAWMDARMTAYAVLFSIAMNLIYGLLVLLVRGRLTRLYTFWRTGGKDMEPTVVAYGPAIAAAILLVRSGALS